MPGGGLLHLYLIVRRGAGPGGCSAYVACASGERAAVAMCPQGGLATPDVKITHLGLAINGIAAGVVLASYDVE